MHKIQKQILKLSTDKNLGELSLREIGKLIGEDNSPQKIKHHLLQLEKNGLIKINRLDKEIEKTKPGTSYNSKLVSVPIFGSANCGPAMIYAENNIEGYLTISGKLLTRKKDIFAIKASGYSMNKANVNGASIEDGDYVIVDSKCRSIRNGDYVLSVINEVANIKRYFADKENKRIILLSESSASLPPIIIHQNEMDDYIVNGKIIQVIKRPKTTFSKLKNLIYRREV